MKLHPTPYSYLTTMRWHLKNDGWARGFFDGGYKLEGPGEIQ